VDWSDLAVDVGRIAPDIGRLLSSPMRVAIGALIATALESDATPQAVSAALADNPEADDKLLALQMNVQALLQPRAAMGELNRPPSSIEPLPNAPLSPIAVEATDPAQHDWVRPTFTAWLLIGALGIIAAILSGTSGELLRNPTASLTVGAVITLWFNELKGALAFYFGAKEHAVDEHHSGDTR
jgi:hypothetical protein